MSKPIGPSPEHPTRAFEQGKRAQANLVQHHNRMERP
jgi:hypothetical protein